MTESRGNPEETLLLTLAEVSNLVSHCHDPAETLQNIVHLIQGRFHTDVCSAYLFEPDLNELVLAATVGLRPEGIGRVRMKLDEGLTGLVAQRLEPVNVHDAFSHPRFKYFPEAGEDPYHTFLGVPLVEGGALQGVLVVQTVEHRSFSPNELRMLVTVAAQLAPLVGEAHVLERVNAVAHAAPETTPAAPREVHGTGLSPGVGSGVAYLVNGFEEWTRTVALDAADPDQEQQRLAQALVAAREETTRLSHKISALVGEDHGSILQAQLLIMQDRTIENDLAACLAAGRSAEGALLATLAKYVAAFERISTEYFQQRAYDIKDVFRRILWQLRPRPEAAEVGGERLVLLAHEASVLDLFSVDLAKLAGVVVEQGGNQSHAAILARSLGIPMVSGVHGLLRQVRPGQRVLLRGGDGTVVLDPDPVGNDGRATGEENLAATPRLTGGRVSGTTARQAVLVSPSVQANINLLWEAKAALEQGAVGVGLYRSEFLFLARRTLPTEDEQVGIYRKLLTALEGRPVTIRTFDLRPDKVAHCAHVLATTGPLDWRLVHDSAPVRQLFKEQVRAILRAATAGPTRLLVPLVTRTEVLDFVRETVGRAKEELKREGLDFRADIPVGVMIEVAGAVPLAEAWAEEVDFFALGTNDLVASALGLERDGPVGATKHDALHPGVLRLIHQTVTAARTARRPVSVCGEMAADPYGALALASLGVDVLSVPVAQLAAARQALASVVDDQIQELAPRILRARSATEVRQRLRDWSRW